MLAGRYCELRYYPTGFQGNHVLIGGARSDGLSGAAEPINISDKQSGGHRVLDNNFATITYDVSTEGVLKDDVLWKIFREQGEDKSLHALGFYVPGIGEFRCLWFINQFDAQGPEGERTFSAAFMNSGAPTWVAAT